jgi:hypothetical protein
MVMKRLLRFIAMALVISGILWALQGLGILMWPPQSFMLAEREWALYGAITTALGALLWLISARIEPRG